MHNIQLVHVWGNVIFVKEVIFCISSDLVKNMCLEICFNADKTRPRPFDRTQKNQRVFEDSKDAEERKNFRNREDHQPVGSEARY